MLDVTDVRAREALKASWAANQRGATRAAAFRVERSGVEGGAQGAGGGGAGAAPGGRLGEGRPLWWCAGEEEDGGAGSPSSPPPPSPETRAMVSSSAPVSEAGLLGGAGLW